MSLDGSESCWYLCFNGTLKDLGRLEFAAHGVDEGRPLKEERKESRKERRAKERVEKKKQKKLTTPEKT